MPLKVVQFWISNLFEKVAPTHCTGEKAIWLFREEYKEDFLPIGVGKIIEVQGEGEHE